MTTTAVGGLNASMAWVAGARICWWYGRWAGIPAEYRRSSLSASYCTGVWSRHCATVEGHLVLFDRTEGKSWDDKVYRRDETEGGAPVTVWGM